MKAHVCVISLVSMTGAAVWLASGCGGDDTTPPSPADDAGAELADSHSPVDAYVPPTADSSCRAYVQAYCDRTAECGRRIDCTSLLDLCPAYFFSDGSTRAPDELMACATARRTQSCDDLLAGITPTCAKPGSHGPGQPCWYGSQCTSQSCSALNSGACGACSTLLANGAPCTAGSTAATCDLNSSCTGGVCTAIPVPAHLGVGAVCLADGGVQCAPNARCDTTAGGMGTCVLVPTTAGAGESCTSLPCAGTDLVCDNSAHVCVTGKDIGATCNHLVVNEGCKPALGCSSSDTCQPRTATGQSCAAVSACASANATCQTVSVDGSTTSRCIESNVTAGHACDDVRLCRSSLECRTGTCQLAVCVASPDASH